MTGTDVREALHAVAETTHAPAPDRLALQRLVQRERRRRTAGRLVVAAAAVAVAGVGVAALGALPSDRQAAPAVDPGVVGVTDLQAPVYVVADGVLVAVDPQGRREDLGAAEDVVGWTTESVWYVDPESALVRRDLSTSDEGPGGWRWSGATRVAAPVRSAQVSADGRYLGWVDQRERLHVHDLKAGTAAAPVQLEGSGSVVDLAQGTGAALVLDDRGLRLLAGSGEVALGRGLRTLDSTATRELVAVTGDGTTVVHDAAGTVLGELSGSSRLSPYGEHLGTVDGDAAWLTSTRDLTGRTRLDVPGDVSRVTWGDDDTLLVATFLDRSIGVYACDVATAGSPCAALDVGEPDSVTLSR